MCFEPLQNFRLCHWGSLPPCLCTHSAPLPPNRHKRKCSTYLSGSLITVFIISGNLKKNWFKKKNVFSSTNVFCELNPMQIYRTWKNIKKYYFCYTFDFANWISTTTKIFDGKRTKVLFTILVMHSHSFTNKNPNWINVKKHLNQMSDANRFMQTWKIQWI